MVRVKGIAIALALGAGIQAFRQWPADGPASMSTAVVVFVLGLIAAYMAGKARRDIGGASAVAVAAANAEASGNVLNVQVFSPPTRTDVALDPLRVRVPEVDQVSWLDRPNVASIEVADVLELEDLGLDVRDLEPEARA